MTISLEGLYAVENLAAAVIERARWVAWVSKNCTGYDISLSEAIRNLRQAFEELDDAAEQAANALPAPLDDGRSVPRSAPPESAAAASPQQPQLKQPARKAGSRPTTARRKP
jgi:hypothetical protein